MGGPDAGDVPLPPPPFLHFVYIHRTTPETPLATPQSYIVSVAPRDLPTLQDPDSPIGSSTSPSLQLLSYSVSFIVPHCSVLRARVQLLQVTCDALVVITPALW